MITAEELANAEKYSPSEWIKETVPEGIRPTEAYAILRHTVDNIDKYLKWLDAKHGATTEYAFTLTSNVMVEEEKIVNAVCKILSQQTCPVVEAEAYLEYTKAGIPHIHGWYKCDKGHRIYQKIFKRYWPLWDESKKVGEGHQGGYHKVMKSNKYRGYQAAEGRKVYPAPLCEIE